MVFVPGHNAVHQRRPLQIYRLGYSVHHFRILADDFCQLRQGGQGTAVEFQCPPKPPRQEPISKLKLLK